MPYQCEIVPWREGAFVYLQPAVGVLWSCSQRGLMVRWSHSLEKLAPAGKNRISPLGRNRMPPGQCDHCDFIPCLSGNHNGLFLNNTLSASPLWTLTQTCISCISYIDRKTFFFNHRTTWEAHKLAQNLVDGEFWILCVSTLPQKQQKYLENNSLKSTNLQYWKLSKSTEQAKKCLF